MDATGMAKLDAIQQMAEANDIRAVRCSNEATTQTHFRLRYAMYTRDAFTTGSLYPDGMERDPHDTRAMHFVAFHRQDPVGTLRMIPPPLNCAAPVDSLAQPLPPFGLCDLVNLPALPPPHTKPTQPN